MAPAKLAPGDAVARVRQLSRVMDETTFGVGLAHAARRGQLSEAWALYKEMTEERGIVPSDVHFRHRTPPGYVFFFFFFFFFFFWVFGTDTFIIIIFIFYFLYHHPADGARRTRFLMRWISAAILSARPLRQRCSDRWQMRETLPRRGAPTRRWSAAGASPTLSRE
jgi:pentatricopeptide repeat protein